MLLPAFDPACYLCPGNERAAGVSNPAYRETFVFVNDFSAVNEDQVEYIEPKVDGERAPTPFPFPVNHTGTHPTQGGK